MNNENGQQDWINYYGPKIDQLINDLDKFSTKILQKQEVDFIKSYKEHMEKV